MAAKTKFICLNENTRLLFFAAMFCAAVETISTYTQSLEDTEDLLDMTENWRYVVSEKQRVFKTVNVRYNWSLLNFRIVNKGYVYTEHSAFSGLSFLYVVG